jgi:cysteinyl-tRNA synthetase
MSRSTGIFLFDTQSRSPKEVLISDGKELRLYCCGPTVYRDAHVGNLRTFLLADLLIRLATIKGHQVRLIQNITDVGHMGSDFQGAGDEDKVLAEAKREKIDPQEVARRYEQRFHDDVAALGITPATLYPRASESIELMLNVISELIDNKSAYVGTDGNVYFDAQSFPSYGAISGNRLDSLKPGHRFEYGDDSGKRFHADWALWKLAKDRTTMIWDSPWGAGFPGWHIECSAMSLHHLHGHIDVHLGGIDLRFPHHENERAQSNARSGSEVTDIWLHGEHLLFEGRKMSKSAGNVLLVSELVRDGFDPLAARLCFMENKYRSQMDLTWSAIEAADSTIKRWRRKYREWCSDESTADPSIAQGLIDEIVGILSVDLDTPKAIIKLRELERDEVITGSTRADVFRALEHFFALNITQKQQIRTLEVSEQNMLDERIRARAQKDFAKSDALRDQLLLKNIRVIDAPGGQSWESID